MIERKNVTNTSDNTYTLVSCNITCQMPFLWDVISIFLSSIVVLSPNGQFLDCVTIAFSERYDDINTERQDSSLMGTDLNAELMYSKSEVVKLRIWKLCIK